MSTRAIIIIFLLSSLFAAESQEISGTALIEEIRQESFDLALLEDEIEYYQNLLNKKEQIRKLYEQNRLSVIREMFERDLLELDQLFEMGAEDKAVDKIWELDRIYSGIESLDMKNYFPEFKMQYYEARIAVRDGNYSLARQILENNLANNLDPENRNSIVALLEEVYFKLERYGDIISIYRIYRGINSTQQRWWLAQALYNTGDLEKADPVFRRLSNEPEYELRAKAMLALITFKLDNIDKAVTDFNNLKYGFDPTTDYYNFINLSLARLYALKGNQQEAINLYDQYVQLEEEINDDILYEIALIYKDAGEYNQALEYFRRITKKTKKSKFFVSAKYLIAITEQDRGNYESGRESLREIIERNNDLMQALNDKYGLLEEYAGLLHELIKPSLIEDSQSRIDRRLQVLEEQFRQNRKNIEELSQGMSSEDLDYLSILEEEYFSYTVTLANFEAFVKYAQSPMIDRLPILANFKMSRQDSSIVYLQIVDYMEDLEDKSSHNYETAKFLSEQKVYQAFLRDIWYDIYHLTMQYNQPQVTRIADKADSTISENLHLISKLEEEAFLTEEEKSSREIITGKIDEIEINNERLKDLEKEFIRDFSTDITPVLAEEMEAFASTQNEIRFKYVDTITAMLENLSAENRLYENTLLDILFRQTMLLDEEFNSYRERISNE